LLDVADVRFPFQHVCRAAVAERVNVDVLLEPGRLHVFFHDNQQVLPGSSLPERAEKQRLLLSLRDEFRPALLEITLQKERRHLADRDKPGFSAFSLSHRESAVSKINVKDAERDELCVSNAGGVEKLHHRAIA